MFSKTRRTTGWESRRIPSFVAPLFALSFGSLALLHGVGCGAAFDESEGAVGDDQLPLERRGEIAVARGFWAGKLVEYYLFGPAFEPGTSSWFPSYEKFPGMPVGEIYVWTDTASNPSLDQQHPIIDRLPLQANYSDFVEIITVKAPADYRTNSIKSRATLLREAYELNRTGQVLNCPVVGSQASLATPGAPTLARYQKIAVWYRKRLTYCFAMEGSALLFPSDGATTPATFTEPVTAERKELRVVAGEIYALMSTAFSQPDTVTGIRVLQNDIFRYAPGAAEYSPLVKVWDYKNGELSSYGALFPIPDFVDPRIEERKPEAFFNASIITVAP
jgi:hypothetical protein